MIAWINSHRYWVAGGVFLISIAIIYLIISSGGSSTPAPGAGWMFMKISFLLLILASWASREYRYLAWTFAGLAVLVFIVLLGNWGDLMINVNATFAKINSILVWNVLGFLIIAGVGIWGYTKVGNGGMKTFLGFASGLLIASWMLLLLKEKLSFIETSFMSGFLPDATAKMLFVVSLALFSYHLWKKSKLALVFAIVVFLATVPHLVISMKDRFLFSLAPPQEISKGVHDLTGSAGKAMTRLSERLDNPPPKTVPPPQAPPVTTQPGTSHVPAPATNSVAPTVSRPSVPTAPIAQEETWNLRFYRGNQLFQQDVVVVRNESTISMRAKRDGTTFRGNLDGGGWFKGTVTGGGSPNGTFLLHIENGRANGELISDERIQFTMKRLG